MNKYIWLIIFMLWIGSGDIQPYRVPLLEDDVVISNALPDWGKVCIATNVRGGPSENYAPRYSVSTGDIVRIHESSLPDHTWVSIGAAQWLPLENLCLGE